MKWLLAAVVLVVGIAGGLHSQGHLEHVLAMLRGPAVAPAKADEQVLDNAAAGAPLVTVATARVQPLRDTVLVAGTLVPKLEVLVAPEVEGLRVLALLADEGDVVTKGQVLARLEQATLKVQLAQNDANLARARAAIGQAGSNIEAAVARKIEVVRALERGRPLKKTGAISESVMDQRQAAARTAEAQLGAARSGLVVSEAELAQIQAQRRDIEWRLGKTEVRAPVAGVISRRKARIGGVATGAAAAEPMFRIIAAGEIELEAEVPEADMYRLQPGQRAEIEIAGVGSVAGSVRLVAPEIDRATRQGRVRVSLARSAVLRIGSFARGTVVISEANTLVLPAAAVLYGDGSAFVQIVTNGRIASRKVVAGIASGRLIQIQSGVEAGDIVVAKAGTFLRQGDLVRPVAARKSEIKGE